MFSVESVEHKCELRLRGHGSSSTGEVHVVFNGMDVDMSNFPPRRQNGTVQNGVYTE